MKKADKYTRRLAYLVVATVILALAGVMALYGIASSLKLNQLESWGNQQLKDIQGIIKTADCDNPNDLANKLEELSASTQYWFVYNEDSVLLEKNSTVTATLNGMSMSNVQDYFVKEGGDNLDQLFDKLLSQEDFSISVSKSADKGDEEISVVFTEIGGETVAVGKSTLSSYIMSSTKIQRQITQLWVAFGFVLAIFSAGIVTFGILNLKKHYAIDKLENESKEKSLRIEELYTTVENAEQAVETDVRTNLYSRMFFNTFCKRLDEQKARGYGIVIAATNANSQRYILGEKAVAKKLNRSGVIIAEQLTSQQVGGRLDENLFAIVCINKNQRDVLVEKITKELEAIELNFSITAIDGESFIQALAECLESLERGDIDALQRV